uniref:Uncharacterized protein n=1 Tax=Rhizophora mucronata TaxID=61149 RepID=A0A2P2NY65_RHIMU
MPNLHLKQHIQVHNHNAATKSII